MFCFWIWVLVTWVCFVHFVNILPAVCLQFVHFFLKKGLLKKNALRKITFYVQLHHDPFFHRGVHHFLNDLQGLLSNSGQNPQSTSTSLCFTTMSNFKKISPITPSNRSTVLSLLPTPLLLPYPSQQHLLCRYYSVSCSVMSNSLWPHGL